MTSPMVQHQTKVYVMNMISYHLCRETLFGQFGVLVLNSSQTKTMIWSFCLYEWTCILVPALIEQIEAILTQ